MKILHYINNLGSGGAERLLTFLLPLLKESGHEVHIAYCNNNRNIKEFERLLIDANIPIHNFNISPYSLLNIKKIYALNRTERFDIIHAHLFPTQYWLAFASLKIRNRTIIIKTEHNTNNRRRDYSILKPLDRFIYSRYKKVVAITSEVKKNLDHWLGNSNKSIVINNGVAISEVENAINSYNSNLYNFFPKNSIKLLMVASFSGDAKDQISLIQSLKYLPQNYHIYFAGSGELMNEAKTSAANFQLNERTHFLGMRTDVYTLMNIVDLNILSSNYEGMSGVTLEGLASRVPFIGSDVPGIREIVPNEEHLFPSKNPKAMAEKILQVTTDLDYRTQLINQANEHVKQYDITNMASSYEKLYLNVLSV